MVETYTMSEGDSRQSIVKALKPLDAISIEVKGRAGVQDINYVGGWIECKWLRRWPKGCEDNPVRFPHEFMTSQKLRARKRVAAGGTSLLSAQVGREWFFFDGAGAGQKLGQMTRPEMIENALLYFPGGLKDKELLKWIRANSTG